MSKYAKRHYEDIASVIAVATEREPFVVADIISDIADLFEQDNERFDRERFLIACQGE